MESVLLDALVPPLVRETHPPDSHPCVDLHCVRGVRETPLTPLAVVVAKPTHPNHVGWVARGSHLRSERAGLRDKSSS